MGYTTYTCACGHSYKDNYVSAKHNYESVVTAPTATAQGYTTHTCSVCGDSYVDSYKDKLPATETNAVAQIGEGDNAQYFATLADAIAAAKAGETIKLVANVKVDGTVLLNKGITLDLNGYVLEAEYLVAFNGNIVDDSEKSGLLKVAQSNISLSKDNARYMPIYSSADEGFVFAKTEMKYLKDTTHENGFKILFRPTSNGKFYGNTATDILAADTTGLSGLYYIVRLSWIKDGTEQTQDFVYTAERISKITATTGNVLTLTVNDVTDYSDLKATVIVKSDLGVEYSVEAGVFNPTSTQE